MKVYLVRVPRRPAWPAWAVGVVIGWLVLVSLAAWLSARSDCEVTLCLFKIITGLPCPTCGSTRGVLAILVGKPWQALSYNPLVFIVFSVVAVLMGVRVIFARSLRLELTKSERRLAWVLVLSALAANWAYVIAYVG